MPISVGSEKGFGSQRPKKSPWSRFSYCTSLLNKSCITSVVLLYTSFVHSEKNLMIKRFYYILSVPYTWRAYDSSSSFHQGLPRFLKDNRCV